MYKNVTLKDLMKLPDENKSIFDLKSEKEKLALISTFLNKKNFTFDFWIYVTGYKTASDKLIKCAIDESDVRDEIIYPIVFCYRQYLELVLKQIISASTYTHENGFKIIAGHSLETLWNEFIKSVKIYDLNLINKYFGTIQKIIMDFHKIDPKSEAFRYPFERIGHHSQKLNRLIDIENLLVIMEEIHHFFLLANLLILDQNIELSDLIFS